MEEDQFFAENRGTEEELYEAARTRLKAVRARVQADVEDRLRLNFPSITAFLQSDAQSEFDKLYLFHMYRAYGFDGEMVFDLKEELVADGRNLNLHLQTLVRTAEPTVDELVQSAAYMMKLHFKRYFIHIIQAAAEEV